MSHNKDFVLFDEPMAASASALPPRHASFRQHRSPAASPVVGTSTDLPLELEGSPQRKRQRSVMNTPPSGGLGAPMHDLSIGGAPASLFPNESSERVLPDEGSLPDEVSLQGLRGSQEVLPDWATTQGARPTMPAASQNMSQGQLTYRGGPVGMDDMRPVQRETSGLTVSPRQAFQDYDDVAHTIPGLPGISRTDTVRQQHYRPGPTVYQADSASTAPSGSQSSSFFSPADSAETISTDDDEDERPFVRPNMLRGGPSSLYLNFPAPPRFASVSSSESDEGKGSALRPAQPADKTVQRPALVHHTSSSEDVDVDDKFAHYDTHLAPEVKKEQEKVVKKEPEKAIKVEPTEAVVPKAVEEPATTRTKSTVAAAPTAANGVTKCDYVSPVTGIECGTVFHRPYDLARHRETIHGRDEAAYVRDGRLTMDDCVVLGKEMDSAKAAAVEWRCDECDSKFSRKDALLRHTRLRH